MQEAVTMIKHRINARNLKLNLKFDNFISQIIIGDKKRIYQVILNLLTNAVKFTSKGSVSICVMKVDGIQRKTIFEDSLR